jgi:hypothetical protein
MSFQLSVITSTGLPYYIKKIADNPLDVEAALRFFNFVHPIHMIGEIPEQQQHFELQAGLVSALWEFSRLLEMPIDFLKLRSLNQLNTVAEGQAEDKILPVEITEESDVILTVRTELFLIPQNFEAKINLIYKYVLSKHIPLGPDTRIIDREDDFISRLLTDRDARELLESRQEAVQDVAIALNEQYAPYGLQAISIASFDGNPLQSFGIENEDVKILLRNIGTIPLVKPYQWEFRASRLGHDQKWVFILNSGCGKKVEEVFMPFYYFLICGEGSFLGDSPTTIYQTLNAILDTD